MIPFNVVKLLLEFPLFTLKIPVFWWQEPATRTILSASILNVNLFKKRPAKYEVSHY